MWISWNQRLMACHSCSASYYSLKTTKRTADLIVELKKKKEKSTLKHGKLFEIARGFKTAWIKAPCSEKLVVWTLGNWTLSMCAACLLLLRNRCKTSRCHKEVHAEPVVQPPHTAERSAWCAQHGGGPVSKQIQSSPRQRPWYVHCKMDPGMSQVALAEKTSLWLSLLVMSHEAYLLRAWVDVLIGLETQSN